VNSLDKPDNSYLFTLILRPVNPNKMEKIIDYTAKMISVVVCVYNEQPNIRPLTDLINTSLNGYSFEVVFVDDGSTDNTVHEILSLNQNEINLVELRKNYGQSSALAAGIQQAKGEYIVTMDGDLQNDPSDIPGMLKKLIDLDLDMVAGIRANRKDGALLRKIPSNIANWIIRSSTHVNFKDYGCTLKIFKCEVARDIGLYGELHRFIPVLTAMEGGRMAQMEVKHHARRYGQSKYGIGRTLKVVSDLMLMVFFKKYLQRPMHLFGGLGILALILGGAINIYLLILKILGQDIWGKPLLILGVIVLIAGFQLITIGIIAELLIRVYYESQQKTPYKIRRIIRGGKQQE
jgi:glycosyltransferase involved in cell wall biosynthesis